MDEAKRELTLEELEKQYTELTEKRNAIKEQFDRKLKEEEDRKKAQLAIEKEKRKKEIEEAEDNYRRLLKAYIADYGSYSTITSTSDSDWYPNSFWRSFF